MNVVKTDVVIDKNFLQGAPKDTLQLVFDTHRVLMPFVNFYELFTTTPSERARCFQRFPAGVNPVALVESVDFIRRWESEKWRPMAIQHAVRQEQFHFNSRLVNEGFEMREDQTNHLKDLKEKVSIKVKTFAKHCNQLILRFPELRNYRPGGNSNQIETIKKWVCTNPEFVRGFYSVFPGQ